jgi:hypothetical protein
VERSFKDVDVNFRRAEHFLQHAFPGPRSAFAAAVKIESGGAKFGIRVTGKMRFGKQRKSADAARFGKLGPRNLADDVKIEIVYDAMENCAEAFNVGKRVCVAAACIDEPFSAESHRADSLPSLWTGLQNSHD